MDLRTLRSIINARIRLALPGEPVVRQVQSEAHTLKVASRVTVVDKVRADELDEKTISDIAPLFDPWQVGIEVEVGDVLSWDGTLVECIQAHTTQADWTPDVTPALWKIHRTDTGDEIPVWIPGISVNVDEVFSYDDTNYRVIQAHTTQEGWEPPNTPALWDPLTD